MFSSENKDYPIIFPQKKNPQNPKLNKIFLLVAKSLLSSVSDPQSTNTTVLCFRISHPGLLLRSPLHLILWSFLLLKSIGLADFSDARMLWVFIQFRVSFKQQLSTRSAYSTMLTLMLIFLICALLQLLFPCQERLLAVVIILLFTLIDQLM